MFDQALLSFRRILVVTGKAFVILLPALAAFSVYHANGKSSPHGFVAFILMYWFLLPTIRRWDEPYRLRGRARREQAAKERAEKAQAAEAENASGLSAGAAVTATAGVAGATKAGQQMDLFDGNDWMGTNLFEDTAQDTSYAGMDLATYLAVYDDDKRRFEPIDASNMSSMTIGDDTFIGCGINIGMSDFSDPFSSCGLDNGICDLSSDPLSSCGSDDWSSSSSSDW